MPDKNAGRAFADFKKAGKKRTKTLVFGIGKTENKAGAVQASEGKIRLREKKSDKDFSNNACV